MTQITRAQVKYLRIHPRKTRFLVDVIRGLPVNEAEARLLLSPRRAGAPLLKLLRSAIANAKHNAKADPDKLFIQEIRVDQGPKQKRGNPRARGSMAMIEKKTSHVTIVLGASEKSYSAYTFKEKPKKEKPMPKEKAEKKEKPKATKQEGEVRGSGGPGFFKKVFRRKSI